ncbi:high affinity cAMP-specific and IBMX-insensitive 3',5'-cyclic phosphodiesterase 8A-like isoform X2 [Sycon ciliatum]
MNVGASSHSREVLVDLDYGRLSFERPLCRFGVCTKDERLSRSVETVCDSNGYGFERLKALEDCRTRLQCYQDYLDSCRKIIDDSIERNEQQCKASTDVDVPLPPVQPYPHVVLVDLQSLERAVQACQTVKEIKAMGRAGQGCCFIALVSKSGYNPSVIQGIMQSGFHSVVRRDSDWSCELLKLDLGHARDRFIIEEAQVAFDMIYRLPTSCEITNEDARIQYVNRGFENSFGFSFEAAKDETPKQLMRSHVNEDASNHFREIDQTIQNGQAWHGEYFAKNASEEHFPVDTLLCLHPRLNGGSLHMAMKSPVTLQSLQRTAIDKLRGASTSMLDALQLGDSLTDKSRAQPRVQPMATGSESRRLSDIPALQQQQQGTHVHGVDGVIATTGSASNAMLSSLVSNGPALSSLSTSSLTRHSVRNGGDPSCDLSCSIAELSEACEFATSLVDQCKRNASLHAMVEGHKDTILAQIQERRSTFRPACVPSQESDRPDFVNNFVSSDPSPPKTANLYHSLASRFGVAFEQKTSWAMYDDEVRGLAAQAHQALDTRKNWECDVLLLEQVSESHGPLFLIGMAICRDFNVCKFLKIGEDVLARWLTLMEAHYRPNVAYHTSTHAADVLQAASYFMAMDKMQSRISELDKVCVLLAAITHDIGHAGVSNPFLKATNNVVASLYMDSSVMENYHCSLFWELSVKYTKSNIFQGIEADKMAYGTDNRKMSTRSVMQIRIRELILATDMFNNDRIVKMFNARPNLDAVVKIVPPGTVEEASAAVARLESTELLLSMVLKAADVCNPARPVSIGKPWSLRIAEEFVLQSDLEEKLNVSSVLPVFTRKTYNLPDSQVKFIQFIVVPIYRALGSYLPLSDVSGILTENETYWRGEHKEDYPPVKPRDMKWNPDVFNIKEFMRGGSPWSPTPTSVLSNVSFHPLEMAGKMGNASHDAAKSRVSSMLLVRTGVSGTEEVATAPQSTTSGLDSSVSGKEGATIAVSSTAAVISTPV